MEERGGSGGRNSFLFQNSFLEDHQKILPGRFPFNVCYLNATFSSALMYAETVNAYFKKLSFFLDISKYGTVFQRKLMPVSLLNSYVLLLLE